MKKGLLFLFFFSINFLLFSQDSESDYALGEVAIRFDNSVEIEEFVSEFNSRGFGFQISLKKEVIPNWNLASFYLIPFNTSVVEAADFLNVQPGVAHAFADRFVKSRNTPNDPSYSSHWGLKQVGVENVWEETTGGKTVQGDEIVIAVIDSGFDTDHPDLINNLWINKGEIAGDNIDNDNNGLIDDIHGYNYRSNSGIFTQSGHGTAVAGIIGAEGDNGQFHAGINWNTKLMFFEVKTFTEVYAAYYYVLEQRRLYRQTNGAQGAFVVVTNSSFGDSGRCENAIEFNIAYDSLGTEGILSAAATLNSSANIDLIGDIPTSCESDFLITVANSDRQDQLSNSGFGKETIDIAAPGVDIPVIWLDGESIDIGTSMSTPHIAGAIGLLYSLPCDRLITQAKSDPANTALTIKNIILSGSKKIPSLESKTVSGGRLDIEGSKNLLDNFCVELIGDFEISNIYPNPTLGNLKVLYSVPDLGELNVQIFNALQEKVYELPITPNPVAGGSFDLDLTFLAAGVYVIYINKGDETAMKTFVKQ